MQNSQTEHTTWKWTAARLTEALRASDMSCAQLAKASNANYYAVRRMRRDGVHYETENARALCRFLKIGHENETAPMTATELADAIVEVWDGTVEHGRLLVELARCARDYKVMARS